MARSNTGGFLATVLALAGTVALVAACNPIPTPLPPNAIDLTVFPACAGEDGPRDTWEPCAWDASRAPAQLHPGYAWVVYVQTCPLNTRQDPATVNCVSFDEWSNQ